MADEDPTTRVVQEIMLGRHDARLSEIIEATSTRLIGDDARVSWWMNVDGVDVREEDVTLAESVALEKRLGVTWANLGPAAAAEHAMAIMVVLLMSREGLTEDEASARAGKVTRREWDQGIGFYDVDPPVAAPS